MRSPLPVPEFRGFAIKNFDVRTQWAEQQEALYETKYQMTPCTMEYDASNYFYKLFLKAKYAGDWPPIAFALIYSGEERDDDTMIMPLVAPTGIGPSHACPLTSAEYNENPAAIVKKNKVPMQQRHPNEHLSELFYGFLQLDYHYSGIQYKTGLHTIEVMLGTGQSSGHTDHWSGVQKYQWDIPRYTPPTESKAAGPREKRIIFI